MQLDRLQDLFAAALIEPDAFDELATAFVDANASGRDRFALYRGNVRAAWEKALAHAFPVTLALLGEEFFRAFARAYAREHPSMSGNLNTFGDNFASFVTRFEATRAVPYLGDVAALEWAVHRAYYAADAEPLARERIVQLAPAELLATRFHLQPALAWLDSRYPIVTIWCAHRPEASAIQPASLNHAECALVVRPQWRVEVVRSSAAETAALAQLRAGAPAGAAIGAALAVDPAFDAGQAMVRWMDLGVLSDMVVAA